MTEAVIAILIAAAVILVLAYCWHRFSQAPVVEPETPPAPTERLDKASFHVRRFTLALEQCTKGEERKAELQKQLDYWKAIQAAGELRK